MAKKTVEKSDKKLKKSGKSEPKQSSTLNVFSFAKAISDDVGVPSGTAKSVIDAYLGAVESTMLESGLNPGESINLPGLGKFVCIERKPRKARNPKTGETFTAPARKAVKFKMAANIRLWGKQPKEAKKVAKKK